MISDAGRLFWHKSRAAEQRLRFDSVLVAHDLDAGDQRHVVAIALQVGHRGQRRNAARGAGGFVTAGRQTGKLWLGFDEQRAEVSLLTRKLTDKVGDVRDLNLAGVELRIGKARRSMPPAEDPKVPLPSRVMWRPKSVWKPPRI